VAINVVVACLQAAIAAITVGVTASTGGLGVIIATAVGALVAGATSAVGSAINDGHADRAIGPTDLSILTLSDAKGAFKNGMLTGLDFVHNATFSNSYVGTYKGPEVSFFNSIY
jgi:hypothetical protein